MTPYKRKTDKNHVEIMQALRAVGCSVFSTHKIGHGFGDMVCGFRGRNYILEVKTKDGTLTPDEVKFFDDWRGQIAIVRTVDEALQVIGAME